MKNLPTLPPIATPPSSEESRASNEMMGARHTELPVAAYRSSGSVKHAGERAPKARYPQSTQPRARFDSPFIIVGSRVSGIDPLPAPAASPDPLIRNGSAAS